MENMLTIVTVGIIGLVVVMWFNALSVAGNMYGRRHIGRNRG